MEEFRIAVATKGRRGLEDTVSEVFGRSNIFTIVDVENGEIKGVKVIENPAVSYKHGAGPIVTKMLMDSRVNVVIAGELGPGVSVLLDQFNIRKITVKPGTQVAEAIREALR